MTTQEKTPLDKAEQETRFYLIFNELAKADVSDVSLEEIDEIEHIRRMVMDVTDETPIFMTST
jgi:hypothetical protein